MAAAASWVKGEQDKDKIVSFKFFSKIRAFFKQCNKVNIFIVARYGANICNKRYQQFWMALSFLESSRRQQSFLFGPNEASS